MERGDSGIIAGAMIPAPIHRSNVKTDKVAAMDGATKAAPPAAESAHVKTRDSPDTAEPPVEEDVALGGSFRSRPRGHIAPAAWNTDLVQTDAPKVLE